PALVVATTATVWRSTRWSSTRDTARRAASWHGRNGSRGVTNRSRMDLRGARRDPAGRANLGEHGLDRAERERREQTGELALGARQARVVRKARRVGKAVTVVDHRIHRRVVDEAFLDQHAEGPRRVAPDGVIGRAIAAHETAGRLLDGVLRAPHVGTEARGAEPEHRRVIPAVAGDLVPTLDNLAHEPRIALSDDSEDEECAER